MKKLLCGAVLLAALAASPADAADYPRGPAPGPYVPAPFGFNWSGGYVGLNLAFQWGSMTNLPISPSGFAGGAQAGYNYQMGQFVVGVEGDVQLSGADDTFAQYKFSNPWFGTLRGRGGLAMNNVLIYLTAGFAFGRGDLEVANLHESHTLSGWTAGGGIEVGFTPNWSAKAEYLFLDLGERGYVLTGNSHGLNANLLRLGVNYRF